MTSTKALEPRSKSTTTQINELSLKQIRALAATDFMPAVAELGEIYIWGANGVKADTYHGLDLLRKAAHAGDMKANDSLGYLFCRGHTGLDGVLIQEDPHTAYRVSLKAAELGSRLSQLRVARLLRTNREVTGLTIERSIEMAEYWLGKAAEQGSKEAQKNLAAYYPASA